MVETPQNYHASRRTLNHVIARAAREGRIFTKDPRDAEAFRHDGDVSNEWEMVTLEKLKRASEEAQSQDHLRLAWRDPSRRSPVLNAMRGRNAHGLLWNSGAALLSILGRHLSPGLGGGDSRPPSSGTTPAGLASSGATWNASTSTPAVGARWW